MVANIPGVCLKNAQKWRVTAQQTDTNDGDTIRLFTNGDIG